jgi:Dihydrodipicolinate reductase, N-terminus
MRFRSDPLAATNGTERLIRKLAGRSLSGQESRRRQKVVRLFHGIPTLVPVGSTRSVQAELILGYGRGCYESSSGVRRWSHRIARQTLRTVVWATGGVGTIAIDAIRRRPDLELVGVWVHSPEKDGRDVGELIGGDAIGLAATNDADGLIALRPDCVVYAASGPDRDAGAVPDYVRLLEAGINVVSTTSTSLVYRRRTTRPIGSRGWRRRRKRATRPSTPRASSPASPPTSSLF